MKNKILIYCFAGVSSFAASIAFAQTPPCESNPPCDSVHLTSRYVDTCCELNALDCTPVKLRYALCIMDESSTPNYNYWHYDPQPTISNSSCMEGKCI